MIVSFALVSALLFIDVPNKIRGSKQLLDSVARFILPIELRLSNRGFIANDIANVLLRTIVLMAFSEASILTLSNLELILLLALHALSVSWGLLNTILVALLLSFLIRSRRYSGGVKAYFWWNFLILLFVSFSQRHSVLWRVFRDWVQRWGFWL